jgi:hypothetical protein
MQGSKTGGRQLGTPNKVTSELRASLKAILDGELVTIRATLDKLPPKDRLDVVLKLMPYCMPKIDSINGRYDKDFTDWTDG